MKHRAIIGTKHLFISRVYRIFSFVSVTIEFLTIQVDVPISYTGQGNFAKSLKVSLKYSVNVLSSLTQSIVFKWKEFYIITFILFI